MVAAPLALAAVERRMAANGDEHVLERRTVRIVRMHVAVAVLGCLGLNAG